MTGEMQRKIQEFASQGEHLVRKTVDHNYTDYSQVSEGEILDLLKGELPTDTELSSSSHRPVEQTDRDIVGLRKAFGSHQEEMLEELRRQPDMDISEKLRILCDCLRRNTGGISKPFPLKLMEMLANKETQHILSWMPHGRAFKIFNQSQFVDVVLPLYFFNNIKYTSFNRQLNLWGFKRLTKGQDNGAYYHELFLRGKPLLAMRMRRQRIKGTGVKLSSDPSREPNFYSIDFPALPEGELPTHCSATHVDGDVAWCPTTVKSDCNDTCVSVEEGGKGGEQEEIKPCLNETALPFKSHASHPNLKSETSTASPPSFSEESAESFSYGNFRRSQVESSLLFPHADDQRLFPVPGENCRGKAFMGHSVSSSSSRAVSTFSTLAPECGQIAKEEITEVEFILRKQRQELELLTALTELKKQEYDVMVRMCEAGSCLHFASRGNRGSFPFSAQESAAIGSSVAILRDQLASVRSLQRQHLPSQQNLSGMAVSQYRSSFDNDILSLTEQNFPCANSEAPVSPGGAMAARRLSLIRANFEDHGSPPSTP